MACPGRRAEPSLLVLLVMKTVSMLAQTDRSHAAGLLPVLVWRTIERSGGFAGV